MLPAATIKAPSGVVEGGKKGVGNTGEGLVVGFEVLGRCSEELVAVTQE